MSNSRVPCSIRSVVSENRIGHEMVSLEVGCGDDIEVLEVRLRQLRNTSDYFHDQLHGTSEHFVVPDSSSRLFRIYLDFLKTHHLHHPDSDETTNQRFSFGTLIDIFEFAKDYEIDTLRNAALDEFFLRIVDNPNRLPYKYIYDLYKATSSNSSLRSLVVDVIVNIGTKQETKDWKDDLPKEFMMDCLVAANEDEIVPLLGDWSKEDVRDWLDEMKGKLCDLFHVHDSEPESDRTTNQGRPSSRMRPFTKTSHSRRGKRARRRKEAEEADDRSNEEGGIDPERQKWVDEEAAERMKYLMEPLPARVRY